MPTIGVACNFYNECNALPGFLESVAQWADDIVMYETGPGGEHSNDGSIEIIEKFGARIGFGSIDEGFGVVRTKMVQMTTCEWTAIMDADERIFQYAGRLVCQGNDSYDVGKYYPYYSPVGLSVQVNGVYDQIAALKSLMRPEYDAIVTSRRHWQKLGHEHPSQNWHHIADWQARILRNCPHVQYRSDVKMHERLVDIRTGNTPNWYQPNEANVEIFHDHYHLWFKQMEMDQRKHDIAIYDSLCANENPPTWAQYRGSLEPQGDVA